MSNYGELAIFATPSGFPLAAKICGHLNISPGELEMKRFLDGEFKPKFIPNIRGRDVFVVCPTASSDDWIQLILTLDAAMRASASRITAVIPYYGYARQDRKIEPRVPISASLFPGILQFAGANRVMMMDLHDPATIGSFRIPVDHLWANGALIPVAKMHIKENIVGVAPDFGASKMVGAVCERNNWPAVMLDKKRLGDNIVGSMKIVRGSPSGKNCLIMDDIADTCGTLIAAADTLLDNGANKVFAAISHPVFSDGAVAKLVKSRFEKIFVSDTIFWQKDVLGEKIIQVSVAEIFAKAIINSHKDKSISELFPDSKG